MPDEKKPDPKEMPLIQTETYTQKIPIINAAAVDELKQLLDQSEGDAVVKIKGTDKWMYVRTRSFLKVQKPELPKDVDEKSKGAGDGQDTGDGHGDVGGLVGPDGSPVSSSKPSTDESPGDNGPREGSDGLAESVDRGAEGGGEGLQGGSRAGGRGKDDGVATETPSPAPNDGGTLPSDPKSPPDGGEGP